MPEPDQSLGKKFLGFFFKEEDPAAAATGTVAVGRPVPSSPRPAAASPGVTAPPMVSPGSGAPGSVDAKFAEHFATVLAQNNPPGPDYFEFSETLRSLSNLGLSEDKQYQAAWASFKALSGLSDAAVLTNTANQYIAALTKDRDAFGKSVDAAMSERVGGLQNEQKRLQTENENLAKQILEIQRQIDTNTNRLTAIGGEITEQSAKITQNRNNYDVTFAHFTDKIKGDIAKMAQYLK